VISRSIRTEAIVFDLVLTAFVGLIAVSSLGLNSGARLMPLVVGSLTLVLLVLQTVKDTRARLQTPVVAPKEEAPQELLTVAPDAAGLEDLLRAAAIEEDAEDDLPSSPEARRKQAIFAVWAASYVFATVVLDALELHGLLVSTPIALAIIVFYVTRSLVRTAALTGATYVVLYLAFVVMLKVPF
jgi:hypothetical protein